MARQNHGISKTAQKRNAERRERRNYPERSHDGGAGTRTTAEDLRREEEAKRKREKKGRTKGKAQEKKIEAACETTEKAATSKRGTGTAKALATQAGEGGKGEETTSKATSKAEKHVDHSVLAYPIPPPPPGMQYTSITQHKGKSKGTERALKSPSPSPPSRSKGRGEAAPASASLYKPIGDPVDDAAWDYVQRIAALKDEAVSQDLGVFEHAVVFLEAAERAVLRVVDLRIEEGNRRLGVVTEGRGKRKRRESFGAEGEVLEGKRRRVSGGGQGEAEGKKEVERRSRTPSGGLTGSAKLRRSPRNHGGRS